MDKTNLVVVGGNVKGDITSCTVQNQLLKLEKNSPWSYRQNSTYITYDVCSKKVLATYKVPEFTAFGVGLNLLISALVLLVLVGIISSSDSF